MTLARIQKTLAILVGAFVFHTAATGPFEGLIQRAIFLALVCALGLALYPLGAGKSWRPVGLAVDLALCAVTTAACGYVIWNYDTIMTSLPWATTLDKALTLGLVVAVLELGRRTVGFIFPLLVILGICYALFGNHLPGALSHRGFDSAFVTETILLGDLGIWGMLTGVAATVIAAFVLFGALLLHTGGGQAFMDLAMRLGGRQPGGAAKIATIASGLFGMISGSAVANVATTGNFTIPMMIRLGYPRAFAAAVEAVASTGGQIAPPIMGAAAFVMAEILGVSYVTIIVGAILPAVMFYLSVFVTVHFVALRRGLAIVPEAEMPDWRTIVAPRRVLPILAALGGLGIGIWLGRSIATSAFYGIVGLLIAFVATQAGRLTLREMAGQILTGLEDAGKGMGLPTTAAYVLVAAVLAPAMTAVGVDPLAAHLFVFYFATISVITPPVCVAVFVGSGIARTNWLPTAGEAVRLGAVTYLVPFLLVLFPGMTLGGGPVEIASAVTSGLALVLAVPALLSGMALTGRRAVDIALLTAVIALALWPHPVSGLIALVALLAMRNMGRTMEKGTA